VNWTVTDKLLLSSLIPSEASYVRLRRLLSQPTGAVDWAAVVRRAQGHRTAALLRFNLARAGALDGLPPPERARLEQESHEWAARHLAYLSEAARLIAALAANSITAIPLKGAALMLGGYYPQAGLRAAIDLDLLVEPGQLDRAERIVSECGYVEVGEPNRARARQRLPNELNDLPPRRGPSGLILELHRRAFHNTYCGRDFGFAEMRGLATRRPTTVGTTLLLPAAEDLCLHLVHHTMVDLQSTQLILRTLADLYFIAQCEPGVSERLQQRADEVGLGRAARLASKALRLVAGGTLEELEGLPSSSEVALLLDTALLESPGPLAEAARLFEYFDLRRRPFAKLGNLLALVFTSRQHLAQLYDAPATGRIYAHYLRRPFDLLRKVNWASLAPANLSRIVKLRKIARGREKAVGSKQ